MVDLRPRRHRALGRIRRARRLAAQQGARRRLVDVQSNEFVARELSMPHSPRWHDGRLWACESGGGHAGRGRVQTGRYEPVVDTPGLPPRGLDFAGRYAFVGALAGARGSVFSGIPIIGERLADAGEADLPASASSICRPWRAWWPGSAAHGTAVQEVFAVHGAPRPAPAQT